MQSLRPSQRIAHRMVSCSNARIFAHRPQYRRYTQNSNSPLDNTAASASSSSNSNIAATPTDKQIEDATLTTLDEAITNTFRESPSKAPVVAKPEASEATPSSDGAPKGFKITRTYNNIRPKEPHDPTSTVDIGTQTVHPALLRDACACTMCVDPSSTQKNFQTTDIPPNIKIRSHEILPNGSFRVTWENDLPGFGPDHVSIFPPISRMDSQVRNIFSRTMKARTWNAENIKKELQFISYEDYMASDETLFKILTELNKRGIMILQGVPDSEKAVEDIAGRIGKIRDTFYGKTWDVRSVPDAKNVAYTSRYLGLHMDLLYMADPPGFQLLHCLKNSAQGGSSLFADALFAANHLSDSDFTTLSQTRMEFQYKNDGEHYNYRHPTLELSDRRGFGARRQVNHINYSPPFQAPHSGRSPRIKDLLTRNAALANFAQWLEKEENVFEYKLKEGECVIFNNRRVLHGRTAFTALGGERWLKGTYIDTDVVRSRHRVLYAKYGNDTTPKAIREQQSQT